ncbi:MAG: winged helix-turn-helix domain-containing protein [Bacteroidota bacterium]|nr:winged helix-turn-helix domain-containing protein [Bacteroidota bacterium]
MIKNEIGVTAVNISNLLDTCRELPVSDIGTLLKQEEEHVFIALGWLAREKKVFFFKETNDVMKVCLIE